MPPSHSSATYRPVNPPAHDDHAAPSAQMAADAQSGDTRSLRRHGWVIVAALCALYEYALHRAAQQPDGQLAGLLLGAAPFVLLGLNVSWRSARRLPLLLLMVLACAGLWLWRAPLSQHFGWTYYLQHLGANTALGWMFGRSLRPGRTPMCTQFAAIVRGPLSPALLRYTRAITLAWTLFFAVMATVSTVLFALAPIATWSTFANLCSPVLVALMFVAEAGCRRLALPGLAHAGVGEAIRGYRAAMAARAGLPR